jgi:hypothetical protein
LALGVFEVVELTFGELTDPRAAADHAEAEGGAFFFGEDDELNWERVDSVVLRGAEEFEGGDDAGDAVVVAAVGDGVDV